MARKLLELQTRADWRRWLETHHDSETEVWLIFNKRHTGTPSPSYDDAVEEALCFGWVDSLITRLDDERYARKFTPRKPDSRWSTANRKRYESLKKRGLLAAPGHARPPTTRSGDAPQPPVDALPAYIENAIRADPRAWSSFLALAASYKRQYVGWIDSAKRDNTRQKRLAEAVAMLAEGKKLGMK